MEWAHSIQLTALGRSGDVPALVELVDIACIKLDDTRRTR
jgi:hypothetical protein